MDARLFDRAVDHRQDPRRADRGGHGAVSNRPPAIGRRGPGSACQAAARRRPGAGRRPMPARPSGSTAPGPNESCWPAWSGRSEARQSLEAEIEPLGRMRSKACLPLLLAAAGQPTVSPGDRYRIAWALGRLGDDRAVPVLTGWLRGRRLPSSRRSRWRRWKPSIRSWRPAKCGRCSRRRPTCRSSCASPACSRGTNWPTATRWPPSTWPTPGTRRRRRWSWRRSTTRGPSKDLSAIVAARPDRRWHAAALTGLAATGDATARRQLLEILADDRNPLAADAAEAAGLAGDADLLRPLAALVQSRNQQIALASLVALRRYFTGVRTSPRGLAAVDENDDDRDDGKVDDRNSDNRKLRPAVADVPAKTRAAISRRPPNLWWPTPTLTAKCARRHLPSRGCCAASAMPSCWRTWPTRPSWKARLCWRRRKRRCAGNARAASSREIRASPAFLPRSALCRRSRPHPAAAGFIEVPGTGEEATVSDNDLSTLLDLARAGIRELTELQKKTLGRLWAWGTPVCRAGLLPIYPQAIA